jgi:hypothetical protein
MLGNKQKNEGKWRELSKNKNMFDSTKMNTHNNRDVLLKRQMNHERN